VLAQEAPALSRSRPHRKPARIKPTHQGFFEGSGLGTILEEHPERIRLSSILRERSAVRRDPHDREDVCRPRALFGYHADAPCRDASTRYPRPRPVFRGSHQGRYEPTSATNRETLAPTGCRFPAANAAALLEKSATPSMKERARMGEVDASPQPRRVGQMERRRASHDERTWSVGPRAPRAERRECLTSRGANESPSIEPRRAWTSSTNQGDETPGTGSCLRSNPRRRDKRGSPRALRGTRELRIREEQSGVFHPMLHR